MNPKFGRVKKMTLESILSENAGSFSFLSHPLGLVGWGLLMIVLILLISLFFIFKQRIRARHVSLLIYHNRQQELRQKTTKQWETGMKHIQELLDEMSEHGRLFESLEPQPQVGLVQNILFDNVLTNAENAGTTLKQNAAGTKQSQKSNLPLDVHELQDVANLAKRLSSRSRQHVHS
jgi:hypothetical protein